MLKQIKNNQKVLFKFFGFIVLLIVIGIIIFLYIKQDFDDTKAVLQQDFEKVDNSADKLHSNLDDTKVEFKQNFDKVNSSFCNS
uniref:hypothetical protein n=1 Tax=Poinsettia branch-inducing phytoplasma TaxID=138647 RepID=UPI000594AC46